MAPEIPPGEPGKTEHEESAPLKVWIQLMEALEHSTKFVGELRDALRFHITECSRAEERIERLRAGQAEEGDTMERALHDLRSAERQRDVFAVLIWEELSRRGGMEHELRILDRIMQSRGGGMQN